jgi:diaminopropionate ammonia-lyase
VHAAATQTRDGWLVVSDTAYPGCDAMPRLVMQGYSVLAEEIADALPAPPSHVLLQCGVGGMAAAVMATMWLRWGAARPCFVIVEPERADCAFQSARAGRSMPTKGDLATLCAGLACGTLSTHAWEVFRQAGDAFMTITDDAAVAAMRSLASPPADDPALVAGECAGVGIAALERLAADRTGWTALGLDERARVVVIGTEGDTDPAVYRRLMGAAA